MNNCIAGKVTTKPRVITYNDEVAYVSFDIDAERFLPQSNEYVTYNYKVNVYDRWLRRDVLDSVKAGDFVIISSSSTSLGIVAEGIVADDVKLLHTNGGVACSNLYDHACLEKEAV